MSYVNGQVILAVNNFRKAEKLRETADKLDSMNQEYINRMTKEELEEYVEKTSPKE